VFPIAAVLASAVGIAYLGAVSYLADRGMVAAKSEEQSRLARRVADGMIAELRIALDAAAAAFAGGQVDLEALELLGATHPTAAQPFYLDRDGHLVYPSRAAAAPPDPAILGLPGDVHVDARRRAPLDAAR